MWEQLIDRLPIVLPPLAAAMLVVGWATRGIRRMWHLGRKANRFFDLVLGEPARDGKPARPSLMDEFTDVKRQLAEHLEWHGDPGGKPAGADLTKPNGPLRRTS